MRDAVIVGAVRTPVGRRRGAYRDVHPVDLSAHVLNALLDRAGLEPGVVDDVIWGVVSQVGEQAWNLGRNAVLAAGWPERIPGTTIDRQCGSSQQAIHFAAAGVLSGQYDMVVAGGAEIMTRVPMASNLATGLGHPFSPQIRERYGERLAGQGIAAEMIADKWGLSRAQLDDFALGSHQKAAAATDSGAFDAQFVPVPGTGLTTDEGIRRDSSPAKLACLAPVFLDSGRITAGNSSQVSDGSAAVLITTSERARELGLRPLVRLAGFSVVGDDPVMMLTAPIPATERLLNQAGLGIEDVGAFEVNEAFASVVLAWLAATGADPKCVNPLGGAIATGHPLGGSGAVLMTRLVHHMADQGLRYGVQTMCEGGGMANATLLELV